MQATDSYHKPHSCALDTEAQVAGFTLAQDWRFCAPPPALGGAAERPAAPAAAGVSSGGGGGGGGHVAWPRWRSLTVHLADLKSLLSLPLSHLVKPADVQVLTLLPPAVAAAGAVGQGGSRPPGAARGGGGGGAGGGALPPLRAAAVGLVAKARADELREVVEQRAARPAGGCALARVRRVDACGGVLVDGVSRRAVLAAVLPLLVAAGPGPVVVVNNA